MQAEDWREPGRKAFAMVLAAGGAERIAILVNAHDHPRAFVLPARRGYTWHVRALLPSGRQDDVVMGMLPMPARAVLFLVEKPDAAGKDGHEHAG